MVEFLVAFICLALVSEVTIRMGAKVVRTLSLRRARSERLAGYMVAQPQRAF